MAEAERKHTPWRVEGAPPPDPEKPDGPTRPRFRLPGGRGFFVALLLLFAVNWYIGSQVNQQKTRVQVEDERRPAVRRSRRHSDDADYEGGERGRSTQATGETERGHETAAQPEVASKYLGPGSLSLEVEQLAALVANIRRQQ